MRVLVWGAGAIGGTMGAYFARAGHEICFVDVAQDHVEKMNWDGLRVEGPIESFSVKVDAFTPETLSGVWETVLLCTKGHHTKQAIEALQPFLSSNAYVVSVQNGLNEHLIAKMIGEDKTVGSFVNFGADYMEPGVIHYGGRGAVVLGELGGEQTARLEPLHDLFLCFDDKAVTTSNIWGFLWGKMAYGSLLYATALTNESIADALNHKDFAALFTDIAKEVLRAADALNVIPESFNGFDPSAFMPSASEALNQASLDEMVVFNRKSAKTHSGIWRDLAVRKRKTEVDAHLGLIASIAQENDLHTPLLREIIRQMHEIENGTRELSLENLVQLEQHRA